MASLVPSQSEGQAGIFSWGMGAWWGPTCYGGIVVGLFLSPGIIYTDKAVFPFPSTRVALVTDLHVINIILDQDVSF